MHDEKMEIFRILNERNKIMAQLLWEAVTKDNYTDTRYQYGAFRRSLTFAIYHRLVE